MSQSKRIQLAIKTILDYLFVIIGMLFLLPVFLIIAICIKLDSPGPVFFTHERVGLKGTIFKVYKFRSMVDNAQNIGLGLNIEQNDSRITKTGDFLRNWSLDELPQIINIIKGEMSFIGPRPTLAYQVEQYTPRQRQRLLVKPGLTGWAQVNGRNSLSWEERIEKDIWYVENFSLWLDFKIFCRTFKTIKNKEGLYGTDGVNDDFSKS